MKNLLNFIPAVLLSTTVVAAGDLTILNAGSKTGSFAMQSTAYAQDLGNNYNVTLDIPGDYCVAVKGILPTLTGPTLMAWASDYESTGRDGQGCATIDFEPSQVVLHTSEAMEICSMDGSDITQTSGKVGHTKPAYVFSRMIDNINNHYGTDHSKVPYEGSSATRTAVINGEVDYALTYPKHARLIEENGGSCGYKMNGSDDPSLALTGDTVWLAFNMTIAETETLRSQITALHSDCDAAIASFSGCGTNLKIDFDATEDQIITSWEASVDAQRQ